MIVRTAIFAAVSLLALSQEPQRPTIRSGVDVAAVDVQVVDRNGHPVTNLEPADFDVSIAGSRRRVLSATLVRYDSAAAASANVGSDPMRTPSGVPRRMFVIAVDEHSLAPGHAMPAMEATRRFIERLQPGDLVALYAYPTGTVQTALTSDHAAVGKAVDKIMGLYGPPRTQYRMTPSEVIDIVSGDGEVFRRVVERECRGNRACANEIQNEALMLAQDLETRVTQSIAGLRNLIDGLARVPARKTLVLVSGGLPLSDRPGYSVSFSFDLSWVGRTAAAANTSVYTLHFDSAFLDSFSVRGLAAAHSAFRDASLFGAGLERIADAAGGESFRIETGFGDSAFERVLRESSAHYLVGVEVDDRDRDGQARAIRVRVKRGGVTVRSRAMVVVSKR